MPCRVDNIEPTQRSQELQRAARLLIYVCKVLGKKPEKWTVAEANNIYATDERCVTELCAELKKMTQAQRDTIVYNARDKNARDLANWWEEHQKADKARERRGRKEEKNKVLREQGLAKLSKAEQVALGLKK